MSGDDLGGVEFIIGVGSVSTLEGGRRRSRRVPFGFRAPVSAVPPPPRPPGSRTGSVKGAKKR